MFEITKGKLEKPVKVCLYAPEGIGKTTFAAQFPEPVFIDTEGGSAHVDVNRLPQPTSWTMLLEEIQHIKSRPDLCKTLVIDTVDWADQLCCQHICAAAGVKSIEDFGYGKGYVMETEEFARMLHLLDDVIDAGINVVLCAHSMVRKFEQPDEFGSYDRYELKVGTKTGARAAALIKEWCDMLLFANYKTIVVKDSNNKAKATGGQRIMYTSHHPAWDAKNRFNLPEQLPFEYAQIAHCIPANTANIEVAPAAEIENKSEEPMQETSIHISDAVPKKLADLMQKDGITLEVLQNTIAYVGIFPAGTPFSSYTPDFIDYIVSDWAKFLTRVNEYKQSIPF